MPIPDRQVRPALYGVWSAVQAAEDRPSLPELRAILDERSGLAALRTLVRNHFGSRSGALRVHEALDHLLRVNRTHRMRMPESYPDHAVLDVVGERLDAFRRRHTVDLQLIDVLGLCYRGEWKPPPAQTQALLRLTGEHGPALPDRLGLPATAGQLREAAVALSARWAALASGVGRRAKAASARPWGSHAAERP
ncbi:hypothetical protein [Streptomyces antibioticus]|uniref:hypothetical protein n=1 Tax=Streptomyces antibioticus TaxID=1890 RepID=UPI0033A21903